MPRVWILRLILLAALSGVCWGAGSSLRARQRPGWSQDGRKLRVLTTIFPLYDFAHEVGGDAVEVRNLLGAGVDPHEYALSPGDAALVSAADVLISNGRGLDDFLSEALAKADQSGLKPLRCTDGFPTVETGHSSGDGHEHTEGDPHLWLDPLAARRYVRRISSAIIEALRERDRFEEARQVRERAAAYDEKLVVLDRDFQRELAPLAGKPFIAFHGAYGHLAVRYGLEMAAVWEPSPGRQPGPKDISRLIDLAHSRKITVFFAEPGFSSRSVEMIARDARLRVLPLDPIETATSLDGPGYLETMQVNLRTLQEALASDRP